MFFLGGGGNGCNRLFIVPEKYVDAYQILHILDRKIKATF